MGMVFCLVPGRFLCLGGRLRVQVPDGRGGVSSCCRTGGGRCEGMWDRRPRLTSPSLVRPQADTV